MVDKVLDIVGKGVFMALGADQPELGVKGRDTLGYFDVLGALQADLVVTDEGEGRVGGFEAANAVVAHLI